MDIALIVGLIKERLAIRANVRDNYITAIANSVVTELEDEKGLTLDADNANHLQFCVDYAAWRYQSRDTEGSMPRHLQFRLHNLILHARRKNT
ncbi:hypothetical protein JNUCC31_25110 [Paenibacillus sp. JNUCC31]|uniref:hypothetical protein n=1 Tax=Paenibacillus sp. JNUCC-31 TaxID=2777983 RepID=UPI00177C627A|nr:hypothetical protein [Paenibacillus sp. JNUCC-31]QOS77946.1 hypothetical protein JNUCC31_24870 [Paenibacillus sp. JNUCC-31]QOS77989.1 hypothetical protein JNUCC31_25110 [Paenibacillus sp. JNUCC-31]